jgi:hypothetical protein
MNVAQRPVSRPVCDDDPNVCQASKTENKMASRHHDQTVNGYGADNRKKADQ